MSTCQHRLSCGGSYSLCQGQRLNYIKCGLRALKLWQAGQLPECTDGRLSAGPVDLAAFLAQAPVQEAVQQALYRWDIPAGNPKSKQCVLYCPPLVMQLAPVVLREQGEIAKG